jgi:hypothetical protein
VDVELQVVVVASALLDTCGNALRYIEEDGFRPAAKVYMVLEGENLATMAKTTGVGMMELSTVFDNLKPDLFDPFEKYGGVGAPVDLNRGYVVVAQHPVTTQSAESRRQIDETLHAVHDLNVPARRFAPLGQ